MPDSRPDTWMHIDEVRGLLTLVIQDLAGRAWLHDQSKLVSPEVEAFDVISERLHGSTYGGPEYQATMDEFREQLDHHVMQNAHHPEAHAGGIQGMSLIDLLEMTCDWMAASRRHADGDVMRSIREVNMARFGFGPELAGILENTVTVLLAMEAQRDG